MSDSNSENFVVDKKAFLEACSKGDREYIVNALKADVTLANSVDGFYTALGNAASSGNAEIVKLLLDNGADVNALSSMALFYALDVGNPTVVQLLISKGVDVNARDVTDGTPLSIAAARGNLEIVQLLLAGGAEVNAISGMGSTALDMADYGGHTAVVNLLRAYGGQFGY